METSTEEIVKNYGDLKGLGSIMSNSALKFEDVSCEDVLSQFEFIASDFRQYASIGARVEEYKENLHEVGCFLTTIGEVFEENAELFRKFASACSCIARHGIQC